MIPEEALQLTLARLDGCKEGDVAQKHQSNFASSSFRIGCRNRRCPRPEMTDNPRRENSHFPIQSKCCSFKDK